MVRVHRGHGLVHQGEKVRDFILQARRLQVSVQRLHLLEQGREPVSRHLCNVSETGLLVAVPITKVRYHARVICFIEVVQEQEVQRVLTSDTQLFMNPCDDEDATTFILRSWTRGVQLYGSECQAASHEPPNSRG